MQAEINIGTAGHVDHGKTTLIYALTKKWADEHSEELKRGITIKLGYANMVIRRCPKGKEFTTEKKCLKHGVETEPLRRVSFIDVPGHETLMAIMMSGAAIIDGVLFVIAANEKCPQPQTREHLTALEIAGIKDIIIVQNKIDLVDEKRAMESYEEIKEFVKGTIAENAPIIPVSAQHGINIDVLLEVMYEKFNPPERDLKSPPLLLVARSFDVNKPGCDPKKLVGGVLGGVLKKGILKVGDEIVILPGIRKGDKWEPLKTKILNLNAGFGPIKEARPGGNIGIETSLDPSLTKGDALAGSVVVREGEELPVWNKLDLEVHLMERVVGTKEELKNEPLRMNEQLMLNVWTAKTLGTVTSIRGNEATLSLRIPVCVSKGEKVAISRMIGGRWRLVGWGVVQ